MNARDDVLGPALERNPVIAILRDLDEQDALRIAAQAVDAGIHCLEVTIETDRGVRALKAVAREFGRTVLVGAGTVRSVDAVHAALGAGARFTVAPGFDPAIADASVSAGLPHLPGVATATETMHATAAGFSLLKAFPAAVLGTEWVGAMAGPFPDARFVVTGGISEINARAFLAAGAVGVGISMRGDVAARLAALTAAGILVRDSTGSMTGPACPTSRRWP